MAAVGTLQYTALRRPQRANARDGARLTWLISRSTTPLFGLLVAPFVFLSNYIGLQQHIRAGNVWHTEGRIVLLAIPVGTKARRMPQIWWTFGYLAVFAGLVMINRSLAEVLLLVTSAMILLVALPILVKLPKMLSSATRQGSVAITDWARPLGSQPYVLTCWVKHPRVEWGSGIPFVEDVLKAARFPPGTPIAVLASQDRHVRFLQALGFRALERDGNPTRAMVRTT